MPCCYLLIYILTPKLLVAQDMFDAITQTHVDHIEEFIDRFNFYEDSQFYQFARESYPDHKIDRAVVLNSLFNRRLNRTDDMTRQKFINEVVNLDRPVTLELYDALWYANVPASVTIDKIKTDVNVILEIQLNQDYSIEWTVIGMKSEALADYVDNKEIYISASSHATHFPELRTALASVEMFENISSDTQKRNTATKYIDLIENKMVSDVKIGTGIRYHFLQISGWIMVVEYVPQDKSLNTGWLISEVIEVDTFLEKRIYQWEKLGISSPF